MKITLFGYGITTKAIATKFKNCKIFDDKIEKSYKKGGNSFYPSSSFNPKKSKIEIPSPGIPPSHPLIKRAKNLISEYDFFYKNSPFSIWITGTNGKTTTTSMLHHLLKERGAVSGGNIGTPLANLNKKAPIWILETSSFTLHYTKRAKPNIYIILPIKEDHISWHKSFKAYEEAKLKPLSLMSEGDIAILPKKYKKIKSSAFKIYYKNSKDLANYFEIDKKRITFKEPFLLDSLLALAVTKILFDEVDYNLINSFQIGNHKLEEFRDSKNHLWVNDSKATNIDATIEAVKRYKKRKIYLILGGEDKGVDLKPLFKFLKSFDVEIFAIGKNSKKIVKFSKEIKKRVTNSKTLKRAIKEISKIHNQKSVALLSPACASFDQFNSYKERGDKFKELVKKF